MRKKIVCRKTYQGEEFDDMKKKLERCFLMKEMKNNNSRH